MSRDRDRNTTRAHHAPGEVTPRPPGRSTPAARLPAPRSEQSAPSEAAPEQGQTVQGKGALDGSQVHAAAAHGLSGSAGALPFLDQIQRAFGHHDVGGVAAHVGGPATAGAAAMGARAYASGNSVAFAEAPDLHTAAHEAAHVVQQRGGVQLAGGVGAAGDAYERHADEVADAVVAGKSAEALLDVHAAGAPGLQRRAVQLERRPVRERQIRMRIRVPQNYEQLREAVEAEVAREVMSRTAVDGPDGPQPIHRERELVGDSNLHELYNTFTPGDEQWIIGRLIPGENGQSYQRLVFELPPADVTIDEPMQVEGRTGLRQLAGPDYRPTTVPQREDRWRRAQALLEQRLGRGVHVGSGPDHMWTPTRTAIIRMMPAVTTPFGNSGQGGDAVPHRLQQGHPAWHALPEPHAATVRVLGQMLERRFGTEHVAGAAALTDDMIGSVLDEFIATARAAKEARDDRMARYGLLGIAGGGSIIERDLADYRTAEHQYFVGDPTCLWRYI